MIKKLLNRSLLSHLLSEAEAIQAYRTLRGVRKLPGNSCSGMHYKVESSPSPEESSFAFVPYTFHYGNGQECRLFVGPRSAPTQSSPAAPPRSNRFVKVVIHVASDPDTQKVEIIDAHNPPLWGGVELPLTLPLQRLPREVFLMGDTTTESWYIQAEITARPCTGSPGFEFAGQTTVPPAAEADIATLMAHWQEITGDLTPPVWDEALPPPPPVAG